MGTTTVSCIVCGAVIGNHRLRVDATYSIARCPECGLEHTVPMPTPEELEAFYATYEDPRADARIVELNARDHLEMLGTYGWAAESRVLDYGAGDGTFVRLAGSGCWGVELRAADDERMVRDVSEAPGPWDFVTLWGVLEHLPDPVGAVTLLADGLAAGGHLALTTVDATSSIPFRYKPPEHLTYWTVGALSALADRTGLEVVECRPYRMRQLGSVYLDRLLSRTPDEYREALYRPDALPEVVEVPTNEVRAVLRAPGVSPI